MIILGIETSCDETGAAIISITDQDHVTILGSSLASSLTLHAKTGGIIPEIAAREQIQYILPVLRDTLKPLGATMREALENIDAIAVTYGPGLIGSLLVGVETARTLSMMSHKPLIPVNHMYGHIYANWLPNDHLSEVTLPAIALVVSGGHTDLLYIKSHHDWKVIGGTRDDAAGEAFDKIGRLLHLPYPAGPVISQLATKGDPKSFKLPRPMWDSKDYDFSFSGLKTAVLNLVKQYHWEEKVPAEVLPDLTASVEQTIIDVLVNKTIKAAKEYQVSSILLGGGVAANSKLTVTLNQKIKEYLPNTSLFVPKKEYCTDNGTMIAMAAYFQQKIVDWRDVTADPELYY